MPFEVIQIQKVEPFGSAGIWGKGMFSLRKQKRDEICIWMEQKGLLLPSVWMVVFHDHPLRRWEEWCRMEICLPLPEIFPEDLFEGELKIYLKQFPNQVVCSLKYLGYEDWEEIHKGYFLLEQWLIERKVQRVGPYQEVYPLREGAEEITLQAVIETEIPEEDRASPTLR